MLSYSFHILKASIAKFFSSKVDAIRLTTATVPQPVITTRQVQLLHDFDPVTDDEVAKLLSSVTSKQCALDPVPTWLVKQCADILVPVITSMVNLSLSSATFPHSQKHARVLPHLKKPDMDVFDLKSSLQLNFYKQIFGAACRSTSAYSL